ncbi:MAG: hypothetical protein ACR2PT_17230 [Endozoicomonas sp.]
MRKSLRLCALVWFAFFLPSLWATPLPCDQLTTSQSRNLCVRFLADSDSSGNAVFSEALTITDERTFEDELGKASDKGIILIIGNSLAVTFDRPFKPGRPMALIGDPDTRPQLRFNARDSDYINPVITLSNATPLFMAWGLSWITDSVKPLVAIVYKNSYFHGEVRVAHCTLGHPDQNPATQLTSFLAFDDISKDTKVILRNNRCYNHQAHDAAFQFTAFGNHGGSVIISGNQWLAGDGGGQSDSAIDTVDIDNLEISGNEQIDPKASANMVISIYILTEAATRVINMTISNNQLHPDSRAGGAQIQLQSYIFPNSKPEAEPLSGSVAVTGNDCYFVYGAGGFCDSSGLKITFQDGECPGQPEPSAASGYSETANMESSSQPVKTVLPLCTPVPVQTTDHEQSSTSYSQTAWITLPGTTVIVTPSVSVSPQFTPEVPTYNTTAGLSTGAIAGISLAGLTSLVTIGFPVWEVAWTTVYWHSSGEALQMVANACGLFVPKYIYMQFHRQVSVGMRRL